MTAVGLPGSIPTTRRRVRRIVRKLDPWTVLKVALIFAAIAGLGLILLSMNCVDHLQQPRDPVADQ